MAYNEVDSGIYLISCVNLILRSNVYDIASIWVNITPY